MNFYFTFIARITISDFICEESYSATRDIILGIILNAYLVQMLSHVCMSM